MTEKIGEFTVEQEGREEKFVILFPFAGYPAAPASSTRRPGGARRKSKRAEAGERRPGPEK